MCSLKHSVLLLTYILHYGVRDTESKQFRSDYTYYHTVDGWLKTHDVPATWDEARQRCNLEGALLASPATADLQAALSSEVNKTSPECGAIHTGVHSKFSKGYFHSIEGIPLFKMALQWLVGEPNNAGDQENCIAYVDGKIADVNCSELLPFVCHKKSTPDMSVMPCGIVDKEYEYVAKTGSCYKFHKGPLVWSGAFRVCSAEGGHLAVINSKEEAAILKDLYSNRFPKKNQVTYIGFFKWSADEDWKTVQGETLEEAGYLEWEKGQPDNAPPGELCGAMFPNGKLDDYWCDRKARFLCEKDPNSLLED